MKPNEERSLIPKTPHELIPARAAGNRILGEIVESSLVLAREFGRGNVDPDALVSEGKRIQRKAGMTPEDIRAFEAFHRAGSAGHAEAQCHLSTCYALGNGVNKNIELALVWLQSAQNISGTHIRKGRTIVPRSPIETYGTFDLFLPECCTQAAEWYRLLAEQGHPFDQFQIGECLRKGKGIRRSYTEASSWYQKAAEAGYPDAQYQFGLFFSGNEEDGFYEHETTALANLFLGKILTYDIVNASTGEVIIRANEVLARYKLREIIKTYHQYDINLSQMREEVQKIVSRMERGAAIWFEMAARQGHTGAQRKIGLCYERGEGVPQDNLRAYAWLRLAVERTYPEERNAHEDIAAMRAKVSPEERYEAERLYQEFKENLHRV
jgi:TPR repeat protein